MEELKELILKLSPPITERPASDYTPIFLSEKTCPAPFIACNASMKCPESAKLHPEMYTSEGLPCYLKSAVRSLGEDDLKTLKQSLRTMVSEVAQWLDNINAIKPSKAVQGGRYDDEEAEEDMSAGEDYMEGEEDYMAAGEDYEKEMYA